MQSESGAMKSESAIELSPEQIEFQDVIKRKAIQTWMMKETLIDMAFRLFWHVLRECYASSIDVLISKATHVNENNIFSTALTNTAQSEFQLSKETTRKYIRIVKKILS